jgi:hypothetical protein
MGLEGGSTDLFQVTIPELFRKFWEKKKTRN